MHTPDEIERQRREFLETVAENDARIWWITRFTTENADFPDEHLGVLYKYKEKARDPAFLPSTDEDVEYQHATTAAARFVGRRRPETIRQFAQVQRGQIRAPNRGWLWWIFAVLVLALLSHGYNVSITRQIGLMRSEVSAYIEESRRLLTSGEDVAGVLSTMCQQTLSYRTAATQLSRLVFWIDGSGIQAPEEVEADVARPGVCAVLANAINEDELPLLRVAAVSAEAMGGDGDAALLQDYLRRTASIRQEAVHAQLGNSQTRNLLSQADTVAQFLNLLIVPSLFALLGSLTSALRSLDARMKDMTLTRVDNAGLVVRVLLGVVAGGSVGIVFSSSADLAESSGLTQIGLAFAVGYAVDIFFNLLDGVRTGLGSKPEQASN